MKLLFYDFVSIYFQEYFENIALFLRFLRLSLKYSWKFQILPQTNENSKSPLTCNIYQVDFIWDQVLFAGFYMILESMLGFMYKQLGKRYFLKGFLLSSKFKWNFWFYSSGNYLANLSQKQL